MIRFILYKHSLIDLAIKHIYNKKIQYFKRAIMQIAVSLRCNALFRNSPKGYRQI